MTGDPIVTVIIPAYNAERTIRETVASVLAQTFPIFNLIIINDGSIDETSDIIRANFLTDSRVILINQENKGVAAARNRGISAARSELIAPLDADDLWHPTYLEKQINSLRRHPNAGFAYAWSRYIDSEGRIVWTHYYPLIAGRALCRLTFWNVVANGSAMVFRKSAALECGGYDHRADTAEDFLLQTKIAVNHECAVTPEYLVGYRMHHAQATKNPDRVYRGRLQTLEIMRNECKGVPKEVIDWKTAELHFAGATRALFDARMRDALQLLLLARQHDPTGTAYRIVQLFARAGRRFARRARRLFFEPDANAGKLFLEAPCVETIAQSRAVLRDRRLRQLGRLDGVEIF